MGTVNIGNSDFELFTSHKGKFSPKITISRPGGLSFSNGSYSKYNLEKYSSVQLYFSKQTNSIAIRFLNRDEDNSVKLKHRDENKGGFAHAKSFILAYGLEKYFGKRFTPKEVNHPELGRILVMDLNEGE